MESISGKHYLRFILCSFSGEIVTGLSSIPIILFHGSGDFNVLMNKLFLNYGSVWNALVQYGG